MTVHTKLTFKAYLVVLLTLTYKNVYAIYLTASALIGFVLAVLQFAGIIHVFTDSPLVPMLICIALLLLFPIQIYRTAKKNFHSNLRLTEDIDYTFTEESISIQGESFSSQMTWDKVYKVSMLKHWVLIYNSRQVANVIANAAFGNQLYDFKALVRRTGAGKRGKSFMGFKLIARIFMILAIVIIGLVIPNMMTAPEAYIIPANYEGPVVVVFDQRSGAGIVLDHKTRVYNIGQNGLLFTQNAWNSGFGSNQEFYIVQDGKRRKLTLLPDKYRYRPGDADSDQIGILNTGLYYSQPKMGDRSLVRASTFVIGKHNMLSSYDPVSVADSIVGVQLSEIERY